MNYSKELYQYILTFGVLIFDNHSNVKDSWNIYNYLLDLYYLKFGDNLRLTDSNIKDVIKNYNEIHGE